MVRHLARVVGVGVETRKLLIALWRFVTTGETLGASSYVQRAERAAGNEHTIQHHSALALAFRRTAELTIRGGGRP
jgi:hypothetical protein